MSISILPSARARDAAANFDDFVARGRRSKAFGDLDFDAAVWEVTLTKQKRASSARAGVKTLYFTHAKAGARGEQGREPLRAPFADFVKAAVRLREQDGAKFLDDHAGFVRAARFVERTMEQIEYDPCRLTRDHFEQAARASRDVDTPSGAYAMGKKLVEIVKWLNRYAIARVPIDFKNPNPRDDDSFSRIGEAADKRRAEKLPTDEELDALASLANLVSDPADVLRMRAIELLVCGGWRINELLSIPADCEVEEQAFENGEPVLDRDGGPVHRYGIRYFGEKGAPPLPKWIPTPLVDVAKRAVADIKRITQPCRDALEFARANPGYLPVPGLDDGDLDEEISAPDVCRMLGLMTGSGPQWLTTKRIARRRDGRFFGLRKDIIAAIKEHTPELPTDSPFPLEGYLFLVPANFMHEKRATIPGSVTFVTDQMIASFIGGNVEHKTVFERYGVTAANGQPIRMNSHQFRHWLNTLAQQGGMSQMEIARWSGRKDVRQNAAYDHVSGAQLAKRVRKLVEAGDIRGPIAKVYERLPPVERKAFVESQIATAHVTDIGQCIHDWSMTPCPTFGACAGCEEHIVVKGDAEQHAAAERLLDETKRLLDMARSEARDATYGADRWVAAQERMAASLEAVVAVHRDASIPNGTLVQPVRSHGEG